jgi:hypothetical protein
MKPFNNNIQRYFYSENNPKLDPWWVTGFTDGEGNFTIKTIKSKTTIIGYTVRLVYQISLHPSDKEILYKLKSYFNVGEIVYTEHYVAYRITKISDILNVVIPHFSNYPLQSTKLISYYLFNAVAMAIKNKEHITLEGYKKILSYKAGLKKGLDATIFKNKEFMNIVPFDTSNLFISENSNLNPNYIAGFVAADGSFFISKPSSTGKWPNYDATFSIAQNKKDLGLLERIILTLGCGNIKSGSEGMIYLTVRNKKELYDIIIPFFTKHSLNNEKSQDFYNFNLAVTILYNNLGKGFHNLSSDNLSKLEYYISVMNKNRYNNKK